jgi:hypothetical protein
MMLGFFSTITFSIYQSIYWMSIYQLDDLLRFLHGMKRLYGNNFKLVIVD